MISDTNTAGRAKTRKTAIDLLRLIKTGERAARGIENREKEARGRKLRGR